MERGHDAGLVGNVACPVPNKQSCCGKRYSSSSVSRYFDCEFAEGVIPCCAGTRLLPCIITKNTDHRPIDLRFLQYTTNGFDNPFHSE